MESSAPSQRTESHYRARTRGGNLILYWVCRGLVEIVLFTYFRLDKIGREHIPRTGAAIIASNHRSFMDPWVIGTMARRPIYYVAKSELFRNPFLAWFLSALGAFPVQRGVGDQDTIRTAHELLARGEIVLIFPEGTRTRPGPLGNPKRGVGRLALESGAPVIPVAIFGTEDVRKGVLLRPRKIRVRAGGALQFPRVEPASPVLAQAVVDRVWPRVSLQWEWLGGTPADQRQAERPELARVA
jgi:glycerol-3-phosphate dehydrogenase (NAD(P)+)